MTSLHLNTETILSLFDCYITSILCYASEVWGHIKGKAVERVHVDFCKRLLGIKRSTNNSMVYAELGRVPLRANTLFNIRYWYRILKTNNCILKDCYSYMYECVNYVNLWNIYTVPLIWDILLHISVYIVCFLLFVYFDLYFVICSDELTSLRSNKKLKRISLPKELGGMGVVAPKCSVKN